MVIEIQNKQTNKNNPSISMDRNQVLSTVTKKTVNVYAQSDVNAKRKKNDVMTSRNRTEQIKLEPNF